MDQSDRHHGRQRPTVASATTRDLRAPHEGETATTVVAELEKVKGVDIKHTAADVKTGELRVALNGTDHITAEDITTAVQSAGVTGHFTKMSKPKQS